MFRRALLVCSLLSAALPAYAQKTLFVDAVNGLDTNDGSQAAPFQTIRAALQSAQGCPGVITLMLEAGVYTDAAGLEQFPQVLPDRVVIQGTNPRGAVIMFTAPGPVTDAVFVWPDSTPAAPRGLILRNLRIDANDHTGVAYTVFGQTHNIVCSNVELFAARGLDLTAAEDGFIQADLLRSDFSCSESTVTQRAIDQATGILLIEDCGLTTTVERPVVELSSNQSSIFFCTSINTFFRQGSAGIRTNTLGDGQIVNRVLHCNFVLNGTVGQPIEPRGGIVDLAQTGATHDVRNSIFFMNFQDMDLPNFSAASYALMNNLVQDPTLLIPGTNNVTGNPNFVSLDDFHLMATDGAGGQNPAIDRGTTDLGPAGLLGGAEDFDQTPRGVPSTLTFDPLRPDIGRDEFYTRDLYFVEDLPSAGSVPDVGIFGPAGTTFVLGVDVAVIPNAPQLSLQLPAPGVIQTGLMPGAIGGGDAYVNVPLALAAPASLVGTTLFFQTAYVDPVNMTTVFSANVEQVVVTP